MTNNLIPFPKAYRRSDAHWEKSAKKELVSLRKAFDKARQDWPLETAELPENNKVYYTTKK